MRVRCLAAAALAGALAVSSFGSVARGEEGEETEPAPLAAPGGYDDVPPAVRHYQQAQVHYEQGRYQEAADELERARSLDPEALELLYNLALVYERLSEFDRAIGYLEEYLSFDLAPDERDRIERMLLRLRGAREHMPDEPEPATRTRVVVHRYGLADGWFWGILATGIALGATAVGTGVTALLYGQEADSFVVGQDGNRATYDWLFDTSTGLALATDVLIGVAGAAALTAILVYALRERPAEEREGSDGSGEPADDWGPPPSSSGGSGGEDGWGPPPPSSEGDDEGDAGGWGPPPPSSALPPRDRGRASSTALLPRIALGPFAAMIGWEF